MTRNCFENSKRNHTNRLNGFLPTPTGKETVESILKLPTECRGWFLSMSLPEPDPLPENKDPLFHLKDPIPCARGNELRLFESLLGVPGILSLGLLLALTFALAETVGVM